MFRLPVWRVTAVLSLLPCSGFVSQAAKPSALPPPGIILPFTSFNFNTIPVGTERGLPLLIENSSNVELTITVSAEEEDLRIGDSNGLARVRTYVVPSKVLLNDLFVLYGPTELGRKNGVIRIRTTSPDTIYQDIELPFTAKVVH